MKLNVKVNLELDRIELQQEGPRMNIPRAYLLEFLQALMRGEDCAFHECKRVTFLPRSVTISDSRILGSPFKVAVLQRNSIPRLVAGLIPHLDSSYVGKTDQQELDTYIKG